MGVRYRSIILHVGLHKTGTTSIQRACQFTGNELLRSHGFTYPEFRIEGVIRPNHGGPVTACLFFWDSDRYGTQWRYSKTDQPLLARAALREQLNDLMKSPRTDHLILSGEQFSLYKPVDLQRLQAFLLKHTDQLRVLVYVRHPVRHLESMIQQRVRHGRVVSPERLAGIMGRRFQKLRTAFGAQLEVRNFDEDRHSPLGLVGSFLVACGLPAAGLKETNFEHINAGISMEAYRLMLSINKRLSYASGQRPGSSDRRRGDMAPLAKLPGAPFHLPDLAKSVEYQILLREKAFFEREFGFHFDPTIYSDESNDLWGPLTLSRIEPLISQLSDNNLKRAAAESLQEEANQLGEHRPDTAEQMQDIAARVSRKRP